MQKPSSKNGKEVQNLWKNFTKPQRNTLFGQKGRLADEVRHGKERGRNWRRWRFDWRGLAGKHDQQHLAHDPKQFLLIATHNVARQIREETFHLPQESINAFYARTKNGGYWLCRWLIRIIKEGPNDGVVETTISPLKRWGRIERDELRQLPQRKQLIEHVALGVGKQQELLLQVASWTLCRKGPLRPPSRPVAKHSHGRSLRE